MSANDVARAFLTFRELDLSEEERQVLTEMLGGDPNAQLDDQTGRHMAPVLRYIAENERSLSPEVRARFVEFAQREFGVSEQATWRAVED